MMRLVSLHRDFHSYSPHGEERWQSPRVSNHGRARCAAGAASFETAGKSRPPQDEELALNQSKYFD
jgi:hypothetical protein